MTNSVWRPFIFFCPAHKDFSLLSDSTLWRRNLKTGSQPLLPPKACSTFMGKTRHCCPQVAVHLSPFQQVHEIWSWHMRESSHGRRLPGSEIIQSLARVEYHTLCGKFHWWSKNVLTEEGKNEAYQSYPQESLEGQSLSWNKLIQFHWPWERYCLAEEVYHKPLLPFKMMVLGPAKNWTICWMCCVHPTWLDRTSEQQIS